MAKLTVLEMVQSTLGAMNSDAVLTIGETIESEQIALVVREVYYDLATDLDLPQWNKLSQLNGLGDTTQATVMELPPTYTDILSIRYKHRLQGDNNRVVFSDPIEYVGADQFLSRQLRLDTAEANVGVNVMDGNVPVPYYNDRRPQCWTTFDDNRVVFDAHDLSLGTTMHNDASMVLVRHVPEFEMTDDFIPDLPDKAYPMYLAMIKEVAFGEQKQVSNTIQERKGKRGKYRNRVQSGINDGLDQGQAVGHEDYSRPTYGRHSRRYGIEGRNTRY